MGKLHQEAFVCLDCETTGLDPENDRIIEIAIARFTFDKVLDSFESLIDPGVPIPESSVAIHHITEKMIQGKPKIVEVLPRLISFIDQHIVIGHGIKLDMAFLAAAAKKQGMPTTLLTHPTIDTLRLARLYGESPINSLEVLRKHFNIADEGAHRAMSDVIVNIEVFKYLTASFSTTEEIVERLKSPILLKAMPLGKHKGRPFSEIPLQFLQWASHQNFDQDLLFSIRSELSKRKKGKPFGQAASPFANL